MAAYGRARARRGRPRVGTAGPALALAVAWHYGRSPPERERALLEQGQHIVYKYLLRISGTASTLLSSSAPHIHS